MQPSIRERGGNFTTQSGDNITLTCTVDAAPLPHIVWLRNGLFLETTLNDKFQLVVETVASIRSDIDDARRSTLTIFNLTSSDSGFYLCRGSNGFGQPAMFETFQLTVISGMQLIAVLILGCIFILYISFTTESVDYCTNSPCQHGGTCINWKSSYTCVCLRGWNGTNCEYRELLVRLDLSL